MSEAQTPSTGAAPSAEAEKNRIEEMGAETDLGAGDQEPDPATTESPQATSRQAARSASKPDRTQLASPPL
jgi:hypothetical protein